MALAPLLLDKKLFRLLRVFLESKQAEFHLHELAGKANVPISTTFCLVHRLVKQSIIVPQLHGKMKFYHLAEKKRQELKVFLGEFS